jgi:cytochrome oxidase Cu insertion factor (SCO1/SenC/PrrC family)
MYRHERSLVERYHDKPFVLLGVNSDPDRDMARAIARQYGHNWRVLWDGSEGPLAAQWKVTFWPSIYVLDARGIVRFAQVRDESLDHAIETLLREMDKP